jgi:hypothetical protein
LHQFGVACLQRCKGPELLELALEGAALWTLLGRWPQALELPSHEVLGIADLRAIGCAAE